MKITVTEKNSVSIGDMDFSPIEALAEVTYFDEIPADVVSAIGDADGVIVNKCVITKEIMDECPNLKYIGTFATGYNNIDVEAASQRGITVCNVPGYSTDAVAEHALAFMLMAAGSTMEYVSSVRNGDWQRCKTFCYYPYHLSELKGKTVGVFGYGAIGKKVATLCNALEMNVIVHARSKKADCPFLQVSANEIFEKSDYITFHCPLTEQTKGLVNADTIAKMKDGAVIINTARGAIVNENDLVVALKSGKLRAYCTDVLSVEPMTKDCPLLAVENCYVTPHVAWAGKETRVRLLEIVEENLRQFINGTPQNKVN